tara:strand:+ start:1140 stop:1469 length:330 start_codon:yes stop_codon:yes gene_type:complete
MAYGRRTRPQNMGANRNRSMRNNARRGGANMPFQGGLRLGQGPQQGPGQSPRGPQQNQARCPVGQKPGRGPGGRMTCVPDTGQRPQGPGPGPGAGIVGPNRNRPNKAGY